MNTFIQKDFDVTPKAKPDYSNNPICATKGCNNHIPDLAVKNDDEFCSSVCARKFYGTDLPVFTGGGARKGRFGAKTP